MNVNSSCRPPVPTLKSDLPTPRAHPNPADALALEEAKSVKSAQLIKQRNSGKTLSSKALKRSNKTVHAESGKRQSSARINFSIKMAGNRNLKQC